MGGFTLRDEKAFHNHVDQNIWNYVKQIFGEDCMSSGRSWHGSNEFPHKLK
jgi:hypothetical protein